MDLPLSEKTELLIQKHLASGKYDSPQQIVEEALEQFDRHAADWAAVQAKIQAGIDDLRAGRYIEISSAEDEVRLTQNILQGLRQRNLLGG